MQIQVVRKTHILNCYQEMMENFTVDFHGGFVFFTKRFPFWSVAQLDTIIHRIVYHYNSIEVENFTLEDREVESLLNLTKL